MPGHAPDCAGHLPRRLPKGYIAVFEMQHRVWRSCVFVFTGFVQINSWTWLLLLMYLLNRLSANGSERKRDEDGFEAGECTHAGGCALNLFFCHLTACPGMRSRDCFQALVRIQPCAGQATIHGGFHLLLAAVWGQKGESSCRRRGVLPQCSNMHMHVGVP